MTDRQLTGEKNEIKSYLPSLSITTFFCWTIMLIAIPLVLQFAVYLAFCLIITYCKIILWPWLVALVVFMPSVALLHWMLKKIIKTEFEDLKKAAESEKPLGLNSGLIKSLFSLPQKVFWFSLPLCLINLLSAGIYAASELNLLMALNMICIPLVFNFILFLIFKVKSINTIATHLQFIPLKPLPPDKPTPQKIKNCLTEATLTLTGGFAVYCWFAATTIVAITNESKILNYAYILLIPGLSIALITSIVAWLLGKYIGVFLLNLSKYFQNICESGKEKTTEHLKIPSSVRLPISQLKRLLNSTRDVIEKLLGINIIENEHLEDMVKNQKMKNLFLATMSHDIKSPLNSIIGFSELLLKGIEGELNDAQREDIQLIRNAGEKLLAIINNILDYARLEAGTLEIHKEWTPSVEPVTEAIKCAKNFISHKPVSIQTEVQPGLPPIFVDPMRISQIIYNMVTTVTKLTDRAAVTVKVYIDRGLFEENDRFLRIDIVDSAKGISEENLTKIIEHFNQPAGSVSTNQWNIGLGLNLSKALTELHNGKIWVEHTQKEGTIFSLGIPVEPI